MRIPKSLCINLYNLLRLPFLKSPDLGISSPYSTRKKRKGKLCGNELMPLSGKTALITGGTSGIGLATASELLRSGICHVFITGIDPLEGQAACKHLSSVYGSKKCTFLFLNVISDNQFRDVLSCIENEFGGIDILFNNAGILEDRKWELEVETNFKAMIRANLLGLEFMNKDRRHSSTGGVIINNSDICALEPLPSAPIYSATKYGVIGMTKCFGSKYHFKKTGVRVVGLCCAATDTKLVKEAAEKQLNEEFGEDTFTYITRKRLLKPEEVGRGVVYLIKHAPTNTLWTIEDSQLYLTDVPHKSTYNFRVTHL